VSISPTLRHYLHDAGVDYDLIQHAHSHSTPETARTAHLSRSNLAKAVVVHHIDGFAMSVVPGDRNVNLSALQDILHYRLRLARESEIESLFPDCEAGAIPPMGFLYGLKTIVDHDLSDVSEVFFEAGDHETVVRVSHPGFEHLMQDTEHAPVSCTPYHH